VPSLCRPQASLSANSLVEEKGSEFSVSQEGDAFRTGFLDLPGCKLPRAKSTPPQGDQRFESPSLHRRVCSHQCPAEQPAQNPAAWRRSATGPAESQ
jgi:hypothetical protein